MAKTNKNTLKNWFKTGAMPTQEQFWNWMDSYWHKDEPISIEAVADLLNILNSKATTSQTDSLQQQINNLDSDLARKSNDEIITGDWRFSGKVLDADGATGADGEVLMSDFEGLLKYGTLPSATLEIGNEVTNATPKRVLYTDKDGLLGEIPGFLYDETSETLFYESNTGFGFGVKEYNIEEEFILQATGSSSNNGSIAIYKIAGIFDRADVEHDDVVYLTAGDYASISLLNNGAGEEGIVFDVNETMGALMLEDSFSVMGYDDLEDDSPIPLFSVNKTTGAFQLGMNVVGKEDELSFFAGTPVQQQILPSGFSLEDLASVLVAYNLLTISN